MDLTGVSTAELERLESALGRGQLGFPISAHALRAMGLDAVIDQAEALTSLGRDAARALIASILKERDSHNRRAELVWTGPETKQSGARDTAVVLSDLFSSAQHSVLVAGFVFDHGRTLLRDLHAAMVRGVSCTVFADGEAARDFRRDNWPFGPPFPQVYRFVPAVGVFASLHAKCVVVDHRYVFVTSANFTDRGQTRNIEVGVLLDDEPLAAVLETQFSPAQWFVDEAARDDSR